MTMCLDILPIELNYTILNKLDFDSFEILKIFFNISYEVLFSMKYPIFYKKVKSVLSDDHSRLRFKKYNSILFNILYSDLSIFSNDIVIPLKKLMPTETSLVHYGKYQNNFNSVTIDLLLLIELKDDYPQFYEKVSWFPIRTGTLSQLYIIDTIKIVLDEGLDPDAPTNMFRTRRRMYKYINTGKITKELIYDEYVKQTTLGFSANIMLVYLLINEYLRNGSPILFDRTTLNECDDFSLIDDEDYGEYGPNKYFYDELLEFIKNNKDKLKYTY